MKSYTFKVPGRPSAAHRPRSSAYIDIKKPQKKTRAGVLRTVSNQVIITSKVRIFPDKDYEEYKKRVADAARAAGVKPMSRVRLRIVVHIPCKGTEYKTKPNVLSERTGRFDIDNLKGISDALNGIAYEDDRHVLAAPPEFSFEWFKDEWSVTVTVTEVHWTDYISDRCKKLAQEHGYKIPYPDYQENLLQPPEDHSEHDWTV